MIYFFRIVTCLVFVGLGIGVLKYTAKVISMFGLMDFAEKITGGGTVLVWKLTGIILVAAGILALGGLFDSVISVSK